MSRKSGLSNVFSHEGPAIQADSPRQFNPFGRRHCQHVAMVFRILKATAGDGDGATGHQSNVGAIPVLTKLVALPTPVWAQEDTRLVAGRVRD
jgi:hypothetical protein